VIGEVAEKGVNEVYDVRVIEKGAELDNIKLEVLCASSTQLKVLSI
jgi:hypothetical protein